MNEKSAQPAWPALRVADWTAKRDTPHMWTQIVGKIRLQARPDEVEPSIPFADDVEHTAYDRGRGRGLLPRVEQRRLLARRRRGGRLLLLRLPRARRSDHPVGPDGAFYSVEHQQFLLPYEAVRAAADPDQAVSTFLHTTCEAAAAAGHGRWDRPALEDDPGRWQQHQPEATPVAPRPIGMIT